MSSIAGVNRTDSIDQIAGKHSIPVYDVRRPLGSEFAATLREFDPDLIVASCFPWRIPKRVRAQAYLGGINLHPSLLPRFRGPDPFFWTYYFGERRTGVTVHQLSDTLDAGTILAQNTLEIPDELAGDALEALAASNGADLLIEAINGFHAERPTPKPQDETLASYQSWPTDAELIIDRTWPTQRALNFVAGVIPLGYTPRIATARGTFVIRSAKRPHEVDESAEGYWSDDATVCVAFSDGELEFTLENIPNDHDRN